MPSKLIIVEQLYYQGEEEQPVQAPEDRYAVPTADEQMLIRRFTVGEEWQDVDTAWVERPSVLKLMNEKPRYSTNPTLEQRAADAEKVLEVEPGPWLIRPGESMRGSPQCKLRIRCRKGSTRCIIVAAPEAECGRLLPDARRLALAEEAGGA